MTTGIAGAVGADPTAALTASQSEVDNNENHRKDIDALRQKINAQFQKIVDQAAISAEKEATGPTPDSIKVGILTSTAD